MLWKHSYMLWPIVVADHTQPWLHTCVGHADDASQPPPKNTEVTDCTLDQRSSCLLLFANEIHAAELDSAATAIQSCVAGVAAVQRRTPCLQTSSSPRASLDYAFVSSSWTRSKISLQKSSLCGHAFRW